MKKLPHRRLAEGEVTGHYHAATSEDVTLYELDPETISMEAPTGTEVTHQEHNTIAIPPGAYERSIVRTVNEDEEVRRVVD